MATLPTSPNLPPGPFIGKSVGGVGGDDFETYHWIKDKSALVVTALNVWSNDTILRGIQVTYSDGSRSDVFGKDVGEENRIEFATGVLVTSLTLWGNGRDCPGDHTRSTRTARISITTTDGQEWNAGRPDPSGLRPHSMEIGSGLLVGMFGKCGDDIDRLGPVFLRTAVVSVAIEKVIPQPQLEGRSDGISEAGIDEKKQDGGPEEEQWDYKGETERPTFVWYTQKSINTLGPDVEATLSSRIYHVVGKNEAARWHAGKATTTPTVIERNTLNWNASGKLQPWQTISLYANSNMGKFEDYKYDSTVTIKLKDGWTSTYSEPGTFSIVAFSDAWVDKEYEPPSQ